MTARNYLFLLAGSLAASSPAAFACSTSNPGTPPVEDPAEGGILPDGGKVDTGPPRPGTSCTPHDAAPATGPKFCDLPGPEAPIKVPTGFCAREFTTTPIAEPRVLRFAPNGDLFITAPAMGTAGGASGGPGAIVVMMDENHDGRADDAIHYAGSPISAATDCSVAEQNPQNLACVHGLLFAGGYLYFTRSDELRRFPYTSGDRKAPTGPGELVALLGGTASTQIRWTHTIDEAKNGELYVSRGRAEAPSCAPSDMVLGSILSVPVTGTMPATAKIVADGFRNPMFLRCQPGCGDCYVNELSGDSWGGSTGGREKLALIEQNAHWGYPCCVGRDQPAPMAPPGQCGNVGVELAAINLHDTPFGLDFETGVFPSPYSYGVFVGLHGAVGTWLGTGVAWIPTDAKTHKPTGSLEMFASGWGQNGAPVTGRAADVVFAPDGRLFVGDDHSGRIFWIAPRTLSMK